MSAENHLIRPNIQLYFPHEENFEEYFSAISQKKFGRFLIANQDGMLEETHLIGFLFQKLKGIFGGKDLTRPHLIGLRTLQLLEYGVEHHLLHRSDQIQSLAARAGLIQLKDQHCFGDIEVLEFIQKISQEILKPSETQEPNEYSTLSTRYFVHHQKELAPFNLSLIKSDQISQNTLQQPIVDTLIFAKEHFETLEKPKEKNGGEDNLEYLPDSTPSDASVIEQEVEISKPLTFTAIELPLPKQKTKDTEPSDETEVQNDTQTNRFKTIAFLIISIFAGACIFKLANSIAPPIENERTNSSQLSKHKFTNLAPQLIINSPVSQLESHSEPNLPSKVDINQSNLGDAKTDAKPIQKPKVSTKQKLKTPRSESYLNTAWATTLVSSAIFGFIGLFYSVFKWQESRPLQAFSLRRLEVRRRGEDVSQEDSETPLPENSLFCEQSQGLRDETYGTKACTSICYHAALHILKGKPLTTQDMMYDLLDNGIKDYKTNHLDGYQHFSDVANRYNQTQEKWILVDIIPEDVSFLGPVPPEQDSGPMQKTLNGILKQKKNVVDVMPELPEDPKAEVNSGDAQQLLEFPEEFRDVASYQLEQNSDSDLLMESGFKAHLNALYQETQNREQRVCSIVTCKKLTIVVFFDSDGKPWVFDSHSRSREDKPTGASLQKFESIQDVDQYLTDYLSSKKKNLQFSMLFVTLAPKSPNSETRST